MIKLRKVRRTRRNATSSRDRIINGFLGAVVARAEVGEAFSQNWEILGVKELSLELKFTLAPLEKNRGKRNNNFLERSRMLARE